MENDDETQEISRRTQQECLKSRFYFLGQQKLWHICLFSYDMMRREAWEPRQCVVMHFELPTSCFDLVEWSELRESRSHLHSRCAPILLMMQC
jgi:hypothetical protein